MSGLSPKAGNWTDHFRSLVPAEMMTLYIALYSLLSVFLSGVELSSDNLAMIPATVNIGGKNITFYTVRAFNISAVDPYKCNATETNYWAVFTAILLAFGICSSYVRPTDQSLRGRFLKWTERRSRPWHRMSVLWVKDDRATCSWCACDAKDVCRRLDCRNRCNPSCNYSLCYEFLYFLMIGIICALWLGCTFLKPAVCFLPNVNTRNIQLAQGVIIFIIGPVFAMIAQCCTTEPSEEKVRSLVAELAKVKFASTDDDEKVAKLAASWQLQHEVDDNEMYYIMERARQMKLQTHGFDQAVATFIRDNAAESPHGPGQPEVVNVDHATRTLKLHWQTVADPGAFDRYRVTVFAHNRVCAHHDTDDFQSTQLWITYAGLPLNTNITFRVRAERLKDGCVVASSKSSAPSKPFRVPDSDASHTEEKSPPPCCSSLRCCWPSKCCSRKCCSCCRTDDDAPQASAPGDEAAKKNAEEKKKRAEEEAKAKAAAEEEKKAPAARTMLSSSTTAPAHLALDVRAGAPTHAPGDGKRPAPAAAAAPAARPAPAAAAAPAAPAAAEVPRGDAKETAAAASGTGLVLTGAGGGSGADGDDHSINWTL